MIEIIARSLAAVWAVLHLISLAAGMQLVAGSGRADLVAALPAFLDRVLPLSRWQRIASRVLVLLLFRSFFTASLNTDLWPWAVTAWVAITTQLLWLRAHLTGYVEIIERGFDRPVARYVAGHMVLDLLVLAPVIALVTIGFR